MNLSKEFVANNCLVSLSRSYEKKKAMAQAPALAHLRHRIVTALQDVAGRTSREASATELSAEEEFTKEVGVAVQRALDAIDNERAQPNAAVDTPEEIERLGKACGGSAAREDQTVRKLPSLRSQRQIPYVHLDNSKLPNGYPSIAGCRLCMILSRSAFDDDLLTGAAPAGTYRSRRAECGQDMQRHEP